jgi:hypothetical protein
MPNPNFSKGVEVEHTSNWGYNVKFKTRNYGLETTPEKEYKISVGIQTCPEEDKLNRKGKVVRVVKSMAELKELPLCKEAVLTADEILAVV